MSSSTIATVRLQNFVAFSIYLFYFQGDIHLNEEKQLHTVNNNMYNFCISSQQSNYLVDHESVYITVVHKYIQYIHYVSNKYVLYALHEANAAIFFFLNGLPWVVIHLQDRTLFPLSLPVILIYSIVICYITVTVLKKGAV